MGNKWLTDDSTDVYIDKVVKRYSKLFGLPSHRRITLYLGVLSLHGGILSFLMLGLSLENFAFGLSFGGIFFLLTTLSDLVTTRSSMKRDLIFNLRRVSALSFFSSLIWFGVLLLGGLTSAFLEVPGLWIRFFFLGFSGALILRLLVLSVTSFASFEGTLFSSLLQPALVALPILFIGPKIGYNLDVQLLFFVVVSVSVALVTVFAFKYFMDRVGKETLGVASSVLFKAFLANWTEDLIHPLETFFETLGSDQDIEVSLMTFKADKKIKAVIVVPALHPGPFKNLGSSLLPSLIQTTLEDKFNCVVSVPHGLVGHELDLSSQYQNQKVLKSLVGFVDSSSSHFEVTPFVRIENEYAKASCQIFGDCALLALTTAPNTMEDLPQELNSFIVGEAKKHGISALAIDAHNSMDGPFNLDKAIVTLGEAAVDSLEKAMNLSRSSFKMGAATVVPKEFTLHDGMGPGGISVIVTEVDNQKAAYVTIDGNNMVSGLREKILSELKTLGITDGEVLTTDTHSVCGMVRSRRGYNLVGEAVDHSKLISYIREAAKSALESLEPAEVSWRTEIIPAVRVIGEQQISEIMIVADKTTQRARRLAVSLFPTAALFLALLLLFLL